MKNFAILFSIVTILSVLRFVLGESDSIWRTMKLHIDLQVEGHGLVVSNDI